jgi:hypothetical protein
MRRLVVSEVLLGRAAWELLSSEEQATAAARRVRVASSSERTSDELVVGVGASSEDVALRGDVDIYFHVGRLADLSGKAGVTVPLIEQWAIGVVNVIHWAAQTRLTPQPVASHEDVVRHARHAADQYLQASHVEKMRSAAMAAGHELVASFAPIRAVLGTGFPWYCVDSSGDRAAESIPDSIKFYTQTQTNFFDRKLLPTFMTVEFDSSREWSEADLRQVGIELGQTEFNSYEYERWEVQPPTPSGSRTLRQNFAANLLDIGNRDWPCHLCTTLHNSARFPQRWERDFMRSCLECNQTPFIPRAVGVLGSDIDLVTITDDTVNPTQLASDIAKWIDHHPTYFRHDTDWATQLGAPHGPLDVFVARRSDFLSAAEAIATASNWSEITVHASVTWLPVTTIDYEIGKYFALCMEPLIDATAENAFTSEIAALRGRFARRVTADDLFDFYKSDSAYLRQLVSNESVRRFLRGRLEKWAGQ